METRQPRELKDVSGRYFEGIFVSSVFRKGSSTEYAFSARATSSGSGAHSFTVNNSAAIWGAPPGEFFEGHVMSTWNALCPSKPGLSSRVPSIVRSTTWWSWPLRMSGNSNSRQVRSSCGSYKWQSGMTRSHPFSFSNFSFHICIVSQGSSMVAPPNAPGLYKLGEFERIPIIPMRRELEPSGEKTSMISQSTWHFESLNDSCDCMLVLIQRPLYSLSRSMTWRWPTSSSWFPQVR
mmetsp:Transcript_88628/g.247956  ORF Transcript_88628/g.247956 Transcript_88628/m.247956 type:complete len:236 (+) Transcript_88628:1063-1770(+)